MDGVEDQRPLSRLESAFRGLVKSHLTSLLKSKRAYWKQSNTVRWVTLGDENSSFFHTMATISHKRNFIVSITNSKGYMSLNMIKRPISFGQPTNKGWDAVNSPG